jgi:hypothetical protein
VTIDTGVNRHPINPSIYGVAYGDATTLADLNCPLNRYGGNNTSRYNWQLNADNRGQDWFFESIGDSNATAGERGDTFFSMSRNAGAVAMLTVPMIGWVAKLGANRSKLASFSIAKYGQQTGNDWQWYPDAGNGVLASNGQFVMGNTPNDANVPADSIFQQSWVQHLTSLWRKAAGGGVQYYILDNEHSIWHSTHRDVHPIGATMDEIASRILDYSAKIKAVDPTAHVVGPEEWGWSGYFFSGYDQQWGGLHGWSNLPDRANHGGQDYLPWLLSQLKQSAIATGQRPLDVFSVHYYPQSGEFGNDTSATMQLLRNRSTRSLWDPNYVDQSWINDKVQLIPRLKGWVNSYYISGTPVAITEYNWGAESHINGATTQADILGIFGREGLDLATRWTTPDASTPTYKAIKMYRNYDGNKATFGDLSVSASVVNPDNLSAFAASRSGDGALTIMMINKVLSGSTPVTLGLNNFTGNGTAQMFQLTAANSVQQLPNLTYSGMSLNVTFPAQSVTLLVLPKTVLTCNLALTPGTRVYPAVGGSGSASVVDGSGCNWTAGTDSPSWITLNGSGSGSGAFGYTVGPNSGPARMATISVGAQSFKLMQGGAVPTFNDVPLTTQYFDYISLMYTNGVTAGCSASPLLYCPAALVTRGQMAVFIVSVLDHVDHTHGGLPPTYTLTPHFQDVPSNNIYFPFIQRLRDLGITNGCQASPPRYCPDDSATQGQMAKFMILGWMQQNGFTSFTYTMTPYFTDVAPTDIFFSYVQKMRDLGFWGGCSATLYCESSFVTRAQMAPLVMRSLLGAP